MKKLNVELKYCYGIKKLEKEFSFEKSNVNIIYAKNGSMKTSFTKVFKKYQDGKENEICDEMFPEKETKHMINGITNYKENIFVIESYSKEFESKKITTLLLKKDLKDKYETEYKKIIDSENIFYEMLRNKSQLNNIDEVKKELLESFTEKDIFDIILIQESKVLDGIKFIYDEIIYSKLFIGKAFEFLKAEKDIIEEYITRYEQLVSKSVYLGKNFNHYRAKKVGDNLDKMFFYDLGHKLSFYNKETKKFEDIKDNDTFIQIIEDEEKILFNDETLKKILLKLDKKIKNIELEDLRDYLFNNKYILPELKNLEIFRKKVWIDYFKENIIEYKDLLGKIKVGKIEIEKILIEAQGDKEYWKKAINDFDNRFTVPFRLDVNNIQDILTKNIEPQIDFTFIDKDGTEIETNKTNLLKVLSKGEERALYLLNIIFEINARKRLNIDTLFIIDDIADSFDYKNKYAIIEYLKDISEIENFKMIILSHNFDFYRTLSSRLSMCRENKLHIIKKSDREIKIEKEEYQGNPFDTWKEVLKATNRKHIDYTSLDAKKHILALIPFVRNLIEYGLNDNSDFMLLTQILHLKNETKDITFGNLKIIYKKYIGKDDFDNCIDNDDKVFDMIIDISNKHISDYDTKLENKIILAIAIRLEAEKIMKDEILISSHIFTWNEGIGKKRTTKKGINNDFLDFINKGGNQTIQLFLGYKQIGHLNNIDILESVNIMTPENIHLNSFMYEPILDMDITELKDLYKKVKELSLKDTPN